jgi:hypothetical protein
MVNGLKAERHYPAFGLLVPGCSAALREMKRIRLRAKGLKEGAMNICRKGTIWQKMVSGRVSGFNLILRLGGNKPSLKII